MTQPNEANDWLRTLTYVLGANMTNVDSSRITNGPWIVMDEYFAIDWEGIDTRPWNFPMPTSGYNGITLYREVFDYAGPNLGYSFQLVRGYVWFFDGGNGGWDGSAAALSNELVDESQRIISTIHENPFLDGSTLTRAADLFYNVANWLMNQGRPPLDGFVNEIDEPGSGFDGSAADAFSWALREISTGMLTLKENITGSTGADDWIKRLHESAGVIWNFKQAMIEAWNAFKAVDQYYNPNWLVWGILRSMERQVDIDHPAVRVDEPNAANVIPWNFSFPEQGLPYQYDLMQKDGWDRLSRDMISAWKERMDALNLASHTATQYLIDSYNATLAALELRTVLPLAHTPPPGGDGPGGGPDGGIGGGGDLSNLLNDLNNGGGNGPGNGNGGGGIGGGGDLSNLLGGGSGGGGGGIGGGGDLSNLLGGGSGGGGGGIGGGADLPDVLGGGGGGSGSSLSGGAGAGALGPLFSSGVGGPSRSTGGDSRRGAAGLSPVLPDGDAGALGGPSQVRFNSGLEGLGGLPGEGGGAGLGTSGAGLGTSGADGYSSSGRSGGFALGPLGTPPPGYTPPPLTLPDQAGLAGGVLTAGGPALEGLTDASSRSPAGTEAGSGAVMGGGSSGTPFMPMPMGGMSGMGGLGRDNERERERSTWLTEDSEVWGSDPECAPAVVGREELPDTEDTQRPGRYTGPSRRTGDTGGAPARGTGRTT